MVLSNELIKGRITTMKDVKANAEGLTFETSGFQSCHDGN